MYFNFMLSKSLIQFSVDGWGCVPSLLFDLRPNYGGGDEDKVLQNVPCTHSCTECQALSRTALTHASAGDSWSPLASLGHLLLGRCSFLLSPGVHKVLFVPPKSLFPQSYVSSSSSMVGLMVTSSKTAYAIPRSAVCITATYTYYVPGNVITTLKY